MAPSPSDVKQTPCAGNCVYRSFPRTGDVKQTPFAGNWGRRERGGHGTGPPERGAAPQEREGDAGVIATVGTIVFLLGMLGLQSLLCRATTRSALPARLFLACADLAVLASCFFGSLPCRAWPASWWQRGRRSCTRPGGEAQGEGKKGRSAQPGTAIVYTTARLPALKPTGMITLAPITKALVKRETEAVSRTNSIALLRPLRGPQAIVVIRGHRSFGK